MGLPRGSRSFCSSTDLKRALMSNVTPTHIIYVWHLNYHWIFWLATTSVILFVILKSSIMQVAGSASHEWIGSDIIFSISSCFFVWDWFQRKWREYDLSILDSPEREKRRQRFDPGCRYVCRIGTIFRSCAWNPMIFKMRLALDKLPWNTRSR